MFVFFLSVCGTRASEGEKKEKMDLLFGDTAEVSAEELVLELLNCSLFIFSNAAGKWIRQTPGDLNRVLIFRNKKR